MNYCYLLLLEIAFEVCETIWIKISQNLSNCFPSFLTFIFYTLSFLFSTLALKRIDVNISYARWAILETALITVSGCSDSKRLPIFQETNYQEITA
jgi:small multidrug resistance pump